ncbi:ion transporter [Dehalococcoides mccartyi]|jgi:voltage-gated potassium channel|uniref:potassium channel family protein n=1 Tax=Dehalococcoides mccartyi TaxID=61435 RepID=UPI0003C894DF|nr:ion transporter [Dehalococcoides mccartyi]AHB13116.1 cation channel protein [Dehalococcoides mccartyi GY50]AII57556.1 cation transporter [Dehalococcoides mccartyi CG1]APH12044.1 potassium channel protein [Dehalococcoides mccartyi]
MTKHNPMKSVHDLLTFGFDSPSRKFVSWFIISLICLNVLAVILGSVDSIARDYHTLLHSFEIFSVAVFSLEYILRVWSCTVEPKYSHSFSGRIRFAVSPLALMDLLSILPFYLPFLIHIDLRFLRSLRLLRLFRLGHLKRFNETSRMILNVLRERKEALIISFAIILLLIIVTSSLMYFVENPAQPDVFKNIPDAMWWSVMTMTTVGYGDIYPITSLGKFLASIISILGLATFALPTAILSAGLLEEFRKKKETHEHACPVCGQNMPKY